MTAPGPDDLAAELTLLGVPPGAALAVAVSGGADSLALLHLARGRGPVAAFTVDHGLRAESAGEAARVAVFCAEAGIAHRTLRAALAAGPGVQARAREARYALLAAACAEAGLAHLATAHTRDDQAETLVMRLARAAGPGGLAGIRRMRRLADGVALLRPVLGWPRDRLRAALPAGWHAIDDPSNRDPRFARTRARALLAEAPWLAAGAADAASHLADAEAALAWAAERAWASRAVEDGTGWRIDAAGLPREVRRRLLVCLLERSGACVRGPDASRLLARLDAGRAGALAGWKVAPAGGAWRAMPAAPKRS